MRRRWRTLSAVLLTALMFTGGHVAAADAASFKLASPAFADGQSIPRKYTCQGAGISLPLAWQGVPAGARSLALIIDDPDAPNPAAPKMTWIHWVLYNIPVSASGLPANVNPSALPHGTQQGRNSWHKTGYGGPCPPIGRHRYFINLFALDTSLHFAEPPTSGVLQRAMHGHILSKATLLGTFEKSR